MPLAHQPDADQMTAATALRTEQWELDDAFLASSQSCPSETNKNHSRAVRLPFKELSTAFRDRFCESTERALYLAQWLFIKRESYGAGENSDSLPALSLLSTAWALGPPGSNKTKPGRGLQGSTTSPSLLLRVDSRGSSPAAGKAFLRSSLIPCHRLPLQESAAEAPLPPTDHWEGPGAELGPRQAKATKPRPRPGQGHRGGPGFFASHEGEVFSLFALFGYCQMVKTYTYFLNKHSRTLLH